MDQQMTMGSVETADAVERNRQNRVTFEREWARLSMPGEVLRTAIDNLPVCGRFAMVVSSSGQRVEYETMEANRVLRDFHDSDGASDRMLHVIMEKLRASGAIQ